MNLAWQILHAVLMLLILTSLPGQDQPVQAIPAVPITRGPFIARVSQTTAVVRWRTDKANIGQLWLTESGTLDAKPILFTENTATTEHTITLAELKPGTTFIYKVGTGGQPLSGVAQYTWFKTWPAAGAADPIRIWAMSDGGAATPEADAVYARCGRFTYGLPTQLCLLLGNNAGTAGTDAEYQKAVFERYADRMAIIPFFPARGPADQIHAGADNDIGEIFSPPTEGECGGMASGTTAYYSFNYGRVHVICLNSNGTDLKPNSPMWTWLKKDLAQVQQDWIIAFWHASPYSAGIHNSDKDPAMTAMRTLALPILEAGGVDLVLTGGNQAYERTCLLDGYYGMTNTLTKTMKKDSGNGGLSGDGAYLKPKLGPVPHAGTVYVALGCASTSAKGPFNHPSMVKSINATGSVLVDVAGNQMDVMFLQSNGQTGDSFRILKGGNGKDQLPPKLMNITTPDLSHVDLTFSEPMDPKVASNPRAYLVGMLIHPDHPLNTPTEVKLLGEGRIVRLTRPGLAASDRFELIHSPLADYAGNRLPGSGEDTPFYVEQPKPGIEYGSIWNYNGTGKDLGEDWLYPEFNDLQWPTGEAPLGFGADAITTAIPRDVDRPSLYFRQRIMIRKRVTAAKLSVRHTDGVIVWINGEQVLSDNVAKGTGYKALASKLAAVPVVTTVDVKPDVFIDQENIVCVMLKSADLKSAQQSIDLELKLTLAP